MKIVFLDVATVGAPPNLKILEKLGTVTYYDYTLPQQTIERIKGADVVITNKVLLTNEIFAATPSLKMVCIAATGMNNIDLEAAKARNIAVTNVSNYSTQSVAQHTFASLFYLLQQIQYFDGYTKNGEYAKSPIFTHHGRTFYEIDGKNWGIIGMGAIGRSVAKVAQAFGCNVLYYSTSGLNHQQSWPSLSLSQLLRSADVVTIHAPLNDKTRNLIGEKELALMKPTAYLINQGRGGIVNETALANALNQGNLAGAALDVLEKEPIDPNNPLLKLSDPTKLLITPHIAWASVEARSRLIARIYENIVGHFGKK